LLKIKLPYETMAGNKIFIRRENMKKIIFAGIAFLFSLTAFADANVDAALKHANAAVVEGKQGKASDLVTHAFAALEGAMAAAITVKGVTKTHVEAAVNELEAAVAHGKLNHADVATQHAESAVEHLNAAGK
jgi:Small metal-binding protein